MEVAFPQGEKLTVSDVDHNEHTSCKYRVQWGKLRGKMFGMKRSNKQRVLKEMSTGTKKKKQLQGPCLARTHEG